MTNISSALRAEIVRITRKETRAEIERLKKSSARYRAQIAALKRQVEALDKQAKNRSVAAAKNAKDSAEPATMLRFSAKGFGTRRQKLGISAADMGALLGVSGQTIYKWEAGKAAPRATQLEAIASIRSLGKRAIAAKLAELAA